MKSSVDSINAVGHPRLHTQKVRAVPVRHLYSKGTGTEIYMPYSQFLWVPKIFKGSRLPAAYSPIDKFSLHEPMNEIKSLSLIYQSSVGNFSKRKVVFMIRQFKIRKNLAHKKDWRHVVTSHVGSLPVLPLVWPHPPVPTLTHLCSLSSVLRCVL